MSEYDGQYFEMLKPQIIAQLLNKSKPSASDLDNLLLIKSFSQGKSGAEVLEVESFLDVPQIEGRNILKITPQSDWLGHIKEENRYEHSGALKPLFAQLIWSLEVQLNSEEKKKDFVCTFWRRAQDQHPLTEMRTLSSVDDQRELYSSLKLIAGQIFDSHRLFNPEKNIPFSSFCKSVLGYRLDPDEGRVYNFARESFNSSWQMPELRWNGFDLPDPYFYARSAQSPTLTRVYKGDVHGDLHGENIFVIIENNEAKDCCLIDSGLTEHNFPLFYDQAYLEVSLIVNSETAKNERPERWLQVLNGITQNFVFDAERIQTNVAVLPLLKQVKTIREAFRDFVSRNHSLASSLEQQYRIQQICAALNFSNKPLERTESNRSLDLGSQTYKEGISQRRFAYLYAAFQLKVFIEKYKDDPNILALKNSLSTDSSYFIKYELNNTSEFERIWRTFADRDFSESVNLSSVLESYRKLSELKKFNRIPSYLTTSYAKYFPQFIFNKAYDLCETSSEKAKIFGFLALAIKCHFCHLTLALNSDERRDIIVDKFNDINPSELDSEDLEEWYSFALVIIEDALFNNNHDSFYEWTQKLRSLLDNNEERHADLSNFENGLQYLLCCYQSIQLNVNDLKKTLNNWEPENQRFEHPEWIVKKSFLMASVYDQSLNSAFKVLESGIQKYDRWPLQDQTYYLEAYVYLKKSFRVDYAEPIEENKYKDLKSKGFWSVHDWINDYMGQEIQKQESQKKTEGYNIVYRDKEPGEVKALYAIRTLVLLNRVGFLPQVWHTSLVTSGIWNKINSLVFEWYPHLCFYYTLQYILKTHIDAEWVREQFRQYLFVLNNQELNQTFFSHLKNIYDLLHGKDSRLYVLTLAIISEFIPKIPHDKWIGIFQGVWEEFHLGHNKEVLYSQVKQGPFLLIRSALSRLNDIQQVTNCLVMLLRTDGDFDSDGFVRPELLIELSYNPNFKHIALSSEVAKEISSNINFIPETNMANYALKKLAIIEDLLSEADREQIASQIVKIPRLPGFSSTIYSLIRFTKDYSYARAHLHDLILSDGKRVWNTGIVKDEKGRWTKHVFADGVLPIHELKYKPTFPQGLKFSVEEVKKLYSYLIKAIQDFKQSPFCPAPDKFATKQVFLNGLDFHLLKEMNFFLEDYKDILKNDVEYFPLKDSIVAGIQEHAPSAGKASDLISNNTNTVREGISKLRNSLLEYKLEDCSDYWFILLSKVLLQQEPQLLSSLYLLSYWIVYYRAESFFQSPSYLNTYVQILDRYMSMYPADVQPGEVEQSLVKIALTLNYWGVEAPSIRHFLDLQHNSAFENVREIPALESLETYLPEVKSYIDENAIVLDDIIPENLVLETIVVQGFKSFSSSYPVEVNFNPLNLLVGANGAGKSSLLSLFNFVQRICFVPLKNLVTESGGIDDFLYYGSKLTEGFSVEFTFSDDSSRLKYSFSCYANETKTSLLFRDETISVILRGSTERVLISESNTHEDSILASRSHEVPVSLVRAQLDKIKQYHIHDTSYDSKLRKPSDLANDKRLDFDAGNLAAVLFALHSAEEGVKRYKNIIRYTRQIFPQFQDFVFHPDLSKGKVKLEWIEEGSSNLFSAHQASDGILRFIALATLLNQFPSNLPKTLILDEPELGLHPKALSLLAGMLNVASQHSQIILATQSTELLKYFTANEIIVVERSRVRPDKDEILSLNATSLIRKSEKEFSDWFEEYSFMNLILRPQDVLVLLKVSLLKGKEWSYPRLAKSLKMNVAEIHDCIKRATAARLFNPETKQANRRSLEEFLIHGVKYAYPPVKSGPTRGIPTSYAAPPMKDWIFRGDDLPPVWPHPEGDTTGYSFLPLFKSVPEVVLEDEKLYELLVLVDALRDGRARERDFAAEQLRNRLGE